MKFSPDLETEKILNLFIANEFFAWQQYFMARVVAKGKSLNYSDDVFADNGNEELDEHFKELVEYAQSMGIDPEVNPKRMEENASAPYRELDLSKPTGELVKLLIDEERQAIDEYESAAKGSAAEDQPSLKFLFSEIAKDERLHLKELEDLLGSISPDAKAAKPSVKKDEEKSEDAKDADDVKADEDGEKKDEDKAEKPEEDEDGNEEGKDKDAEDKPKKSERKIGKVFDMAKAFKDASKKEKAEKDEKKDDDVEESEEDESDEPVNECFGGKFIRCTDMFSEAFSRK